MKKEHMTKKAVRRVLREYWAQYTKYPVLALASFLLPGLGSIFVFLIPPLVISKIVNMIAAGTPISISSLGGSIALFGGLWLLGEFLWRTGMYTLTQLETKAMKNISNLTFGLLLERDYNFYANNFVGSLTKKAQALSRNFEIFTDTFSFNVTPTVLPMIFALIVLSRYSPIISLVLVISLVLLVIFIVPRIRKRAALVAERHETGSRLVGGLSDVVTNMIAVKSFAKEDIEHKHLNGLAEKFTKDVVERSFVERVGKFFCQTIEMLVLYVFFCK